MMDATVVQPYKMSLFPVGMTNQRRRMMGIMRIKVPRRSSPFILSVLANKDVDDPSRSLNFDHCRIHNKKNEYKDNLFDRMAINHLSASLQAATGLKSETSGYEGLIEAAMMTSRRFSPAEQTKVVIQTLDTFCPKPISALMKMLLPQWKFAREYCAIFTTIFFPWLVGPCEVRESTIDGKTERNVVYIPKCRFLEGTNCVGMCTNLCKMPSQTFIKEHLGIPINMVPNYEDMSCEMIFGQEPPPQSADPAFSQPCYKQCKSIRRNQRICTN